MRTLLRLVCVRSGPGIGWWRRSVVSRQRRLAIPRRLRLPRGTSQCPQCKAKARLYRALPTATISVDASLCVLPEAAPQFPSQDLAGTSLGQLMREELEALGDFVAGQALSADAP